jgi:hypothetical protein
MATMYRLALAALFLLMGAARADPVISVGSPFAGPSGTVYPIEISGAVNLATWTFDLSFNPASVNVIDSPDCDPFLDIYCNFGFAGVTEGPFTSSSGTRFTVFLPGFIDNTNGFLDSVFGAYADVAPGPSGGGVLAYVEFKTVSEQESPDVRIDSASVTSGVPEPTTIFLLAAGLLQLVVRRMKQVQA